MPVLPTPHMGSVNTPATPTTRATSQAYLIIPSYAGTTNATYGVCLHSGYSYDTCDLNTVSPYPLYVGTTNATYEVCQHTGYSYDTCNLNTVSHDGTYTV
ncbi:unnamed protein product [Prunus armeniaca]